jgi:hypothetical protein
LYDPVIPDCDPLAEVGIGELVKLENPAAQLNPSESGFSPLSGALKQQSIPEDEALSKGFGIMRIDIEHPILGQDPTFLASALSLRGNDPLTAAIEKTDTQRKDE